MTISNLPQRPEENINSSTELHQDWMSNEIEITARFLSVVNSRNFSPLDVEFVKKQQDYDFGIESSEALIIRSVDEPEDCLWFDMTDASKWEDEEERSELAEIEEDRIFYTAQMCI